MSSVVYFISDDLGRIKIGHSISVHDRLRELQTASAGKLKVVGLCHGGRYEESILHQRFDHYRLNGEWFCAGPDLLDFIEKNCFSHEPKAPKVPDFTDFSNGRREFATKIINFIKKRHPTNTASRIAIELNIPTTTVQKWIERGSVPSAAIFVSMIALYGRQFLADIWMDGEDIPA